MRYVNQLLDLCLSQNIKISVAESCTSGLISSRLASQAGCSSYFQGGVIAYNNEVKINILNVNKDLIMNNSEVSEQVVIEMARGVSNIFKSDYSIATSGYAGPKGGDLNNPIGTVFFAISSKEKSLVNRFVFEGNRLDIMQQAADKAIELLYKTIKK